jgi:hypothetical protein
LGVSSTLAGAVGLVEERVDWRLEEEEEPSLLRKVLVRVRSLLKPFSFFSSLGVDGPAGEGELMLLDLV